MNHDGLAVGCDLAAERPEVVIPPALRVGEGVPGALADRPPLAFSIIVLVGFAAMPPLVIREEVPANQRDMVTLLLGTFAGGNISETASLL
jgi:hypothetical protein